MGLKIPWGFVPVRVRFPPQAFLVMYSVDAYKLYNSILKFPNLSILVIGDLILDEYLYGEIERISPEAPVQVVDIKEKSDTLGGAANVANNIISLGAKVFLTGVIGDDKTGSLFIKRLKEKGISTDGIFIDHKRPTTKKTRVIANNQHVIRLDQESRDKIHPEIEKKIIEFALSNINKIDAIVISDYAKGVITENIIPSILKSSCQKPIIVDPKGKDFTKYRGATAITPNRKEAIQASGQKDVIKAGRKFLEELQLKAVVVTLGKDGIFFIENSGNHAHIPAFAKEVYDVSGAGDTVISCISLSMASGLSCYESAYLANMAGGIAVGKLGTAPVLKDELINALFLEGSGKTRKILTTSELVQKAIQLKKQGRKIVFTNGCFDLIHPGHIHLLKESKRLGDILIVALDDDDSVKRIKGAGRPILSQFERAQIISSLDCVDFVVIFSTDELTALLKSIKPDVLTKGEDYTLKEVVGKEIVERYGGKVILIPFSQRSSSSELINKIKNIGAGA